MTPKVNVNIPVRNIESGKQRMNEVMHGALNAQKHKYARYDLKAVSYTHLTLPTILLV